MERFVSKPSSPATSRYAAEALVFLGKLVRQGRLERKETAAHFAARAGMSRGLLQRIENGDPGCSAGAVFEAAALTGIRLFDLDPDALRASSQTAERILTLLPKSARATRKPVDDDF